MLKGLVAFVIDSLFHYKPDATIKIVYNIHKVWPTNERETPADTEATKKKGEAEKTHEAKKAAKSRRFCVFSHAAARMKRERKIFGVKDKLTKA